MSVLFEQIYALRDDSQVEGLSRFFKTGPGQYGEGDRFLGIKVPRVREAVKRVWKECTFDDLEECIQSEFHEVRLAALLVLIQIFKHAETDTGKQQQCVDFYLKNTICINNWDLVDLSCYELLGRWLMDKDRQLLYDLARDGRSMWEQRIAIVSCMAFVRKGESLSAQPYSCWLMRFDEKVLVDYLAPRYKTMPRTTLRYAIEKFSPEVRRKYLDGQIY